MQPHDMPMQVQRGGGGHLKPIRNLAAGGSGWSERRLCRFISGKDAIPSVKEAGWDLRRGGRGCSGWHEKCRLHLLSNHLRPASNESLCRHCFPSRLQWASGGFSEGIKVEKPQICLSAATWTILTECFCGLFFIYYS
jgi:hypothetical protein